MWLRDRGYDRVKGGSMFLYMLNCSLDTWIHLSRYFMYFSYTDCWTQIVQGHIYTFVWMSVKYKKCIVVFSFLCFTAFVWLTAYLEFVLCRSVFIPLTSSFEVACLCVCKWRYRLLIHAFLPMVTTTFLICWTQVFQLINMSICQQLTEITRKSHTHKPHIHTERSKRFLFTFLFSASKIDQRWLMFQCLVGE